VPRSFLMIMGRHRASVAVYERPGIVGWPQKTVQLSPPPLSTWLAMACPPPPPMLYSCKPPCLIYLPCNFYLCSLLIEETTGASTF